MWPVLPIYISLFNSSTALRYLMTIIITFFHGIGTISLPDSKLHLFFGLPTKLFFFLIFQYWDIIGPSDSMLRCKVLKNYTFSVIFLYLNLFILNADKLRTLFSVGMFHTFSTIYKLRCVKKWRWYFCYFLKSSDLMHTSVQCIVNILV